MTITSSRSILAWIGVLIILIAPLFGASTVLANGAPVDIYLSYMPNVSNWGPQDATGHAVVAVGDGEVSLDVQGLPRLSNEHYEVWLESRIARKFYSAGKFNAKADGIGHLQVLLDTLPYQEYRMLLITVEPEPDPSPEPDARHSLAGLFPNTAVVQTTEITPTPAGSGVGTGTGAGSAPGAAITEGQRPVHLPVTGGTPSWPWLALGAGILIGAGLLAARQTRPEASK